MNSRAQQCAWQARAAWSVVSITAVLITSSASAQVLEDAGVITASRASASATALSVAGRVTDLDGQPVEDARVLIVTGEFGRSARPTGVYLHNGLPYLWQVVGPVGVDKEGRFEIKVPHSQSGVYSGLAIYAAAAGYGSAMQPLRISGDQKVELKLGPEHVVRGWLIDLKGQPAAEAEVRVVKHGWRPPGQLLAMWEPVFSDAQGRFLIRGLSSDKVTLQIAGEQYTPHQQEVDPVPIEAVDEVTVSLSPAKSLRGRVTFADTGQPAAHCRIIAPAAHVGDPRWVETHTDDDGSFSLNPFPLDERFRFGPAQYIINIFPPGDAPYLVSQIMVPVTRASNEPLRVQLERGVLVHGSVTEAETGMPVSGARVQYTVRDRNYMAGHIEPSRLQTAITESDGSFELPVEPEPGHLFVLGPTLDYVPVETSDEELHGGKPGKKRLYADAIIPLDFDADTTEHLVDIQLRRGVTLRGRVLGKDGKPASSFVLFSPSYIVTGYSLNYDPNTLNCANGTFELPGCDPDKVHTVFLLDVENRLGATVKLSREHQDVPAVVRLEPCGSARARLVDKDRNPLADFRPQFKYVLTDGAPQRVYIGNPEGLAVEADEGYPQSLDPQTYGGLKTDKEGRIAFPALVPGAKYRISWTPEDITSPEAWPHIDFTVRAGETKDLGEIVVKGEVQ